MTAERGSTTHGARADDALADELRGTLGPGGSNREEWREDEPDDTPAADVTDYTPGGDPEPGPEVDLDVDEERPVDIVADDERRSDMDVAFDWSSENR